MSTETARLAERVAALERLLARTSRTASLAYSSIEAGAIAVHGEDGTLTGVIGQQPDGTTGVVVVNGPPPPTPSAPVVESAVAGLRVLWDGGFVDAVAAPLDLARVQVHLLGSESAVPDVRTPTATIEAGSGASVTIALATYDELWVRLVAVNTSGIPGPASTDVRAAPRQATADDVDTSAFVIAGAQVTGSVQVAASAATVTGQIGSGVVVPAGQLSSGPLPAGVTLDGRSVLPGTVDRARLSAGAVDMTILSAALADTSAQRYVDTLADSTAWRALSLGTGATWRHLTGVSDAPTGQAVGQAAGYTVVRGTTQIPVDPDTLYRVSARVRTTAGSAAGSDTVYVGVLGIAADGVTFVNRTGANAFTSAYYVAASAASLPMAAGWTVYTGYVKGRAASGTSGTGGVAADPRAPGILHADVRYISPIVFANYASGVSGANSATGVVQVDAFTIEALKTGVVDGTNLIVGSVTAAALSADAITGKVVTGGIVRTAADGTRLVLSPDAGGSSVPGLALFSGHPQEYHPGVLSSNTVTVGTTLQPQAWLAAPQIDAGVAQLSLRSPTQSSNGSFQLETDTSRGYCYIKGSGTPGTGTSEVEIFAQDGDGGPASAALVQGSRVFLRSGLVSLTVTPSGVSVAGGPVMSNNVVLVDGPKTWTTLTLKAGFTHANGNARWRLVTIAGQQFLQMAGTVTVSAAGGLTADTVFATMTSSTPSYSIHVAVARNQSAGIGTTKIQWGTDGSFTVYTSSISNVAWFSLQGLLLPLT
ncbi:hypothetical protein [Streptomyces beijiangensis]|uniref:Uncharacterized protein n=1 Tax=Streptomyces beijiangensis TaxID=163361 RepID=A0A939JKL0_9ACTN|nr:hypothetical protein [Streptomyces beijiangensis]MBO0514789.1 hypothetical protein [Streptomyces beijiangensis]